MTENRALVVQKQNRLMVREAMTPYKGSPIALGISLRHLNKLIVEYRLAEHDINELVACRFEHKASWHTMMKLFAQDFSAEEVYILYKVREEVSETIGSKPSFTVIVMFQNIFYGNQLSPDSESEELAEAIINAHKGFTQLMGEDWWPDESLKAICNAAKELNTTSVEEALEALTVLRPPTRKVPEYPSGYRPLANSFYCPSPKMGQEEPAPKLTLPLALDVLQPRMKARRRNV